jgi:hypothetical protein
MWHEIFASLGGHSAQKLSWRRILTEGALLAGLMATASWLTR